MLLSNSAQNGLAPTNCPFCLSAYFWGVWPYVLHWSTRQGVSRSVKLTAFVVNRFSQLPCKVFARRAEGSGTAASLELAGPSTASDEAAAGRQRRVEKLSRPCS
jgi:hypothetical protein